MKDIFIHMQLILGGLCSVIEGFLDCLHIINNCYPLYDALELWLSTAHPAKTDQPLEYESFLGVIVIRYIKLLFRN